MTETDWVELVGKIRGYVDPWRAEELLRTRIEAAFVPVADIENCVSVSVARADEATARAEAAEGRVKVLEEALRVCADAPLSGWTIAQAYARQSLGAEHGK